MRYVIIFVALLLPVQAAALSCLRPSVARTYHEADAATQDYLVVVGRLTLDMRQLPKTSHGTANPPKMTRIKGRLRGKSMAANGFTVPFDQRLTLEVACFGPWCGGAENGQEVLAFVRRDAPGRYAIAITPCGGHVFANPKKSHLDTAMRCARGKACKG
ncbi:hypothetical protein [Sulfitobacter aestuariivivens]|uniref:Uncharacterized protein n=1 Tax=Sulfitobacter aestuariivivens TaxID=2766981 RepID=A0A927HFV5_9RHOB|nr:hypothetical protein [Sulfitobacter aestuariivivens]MBD3664824.1 hypothetical protein [Sulfitobacter aestuariivivens]